MTSPVRVKFWGVRGSIPAPITSADVRGKKLKAIEDFLDAVKTGAMSPEEFMAREDALSPHAYGGNTSCVEVRWEDRIFVLDMGTGLRPLGNALFPEMFKQRGLAIDFVLSHVHWDHIQGLPFFGPLYVNKESGVSNRWHFYGGTTWQKTAEVCLRGQMDPPTFPVSFAEIERITGDIRFTDVHDWLTVGKVGSEPVIRFAKLHHPQETYGVRLAFPSGAVVVYTTDNEPYHPEYPDPQLLRLTQDADIWITDCQYSLHQYLGIEGGISRRGWGHSYPEDVARVAVQAGVKTVVLFHHDPASSDERIAGLRDDTQTLIARSGGSTKVLAAWEGLELSV